MVESDPARFENLAQRVAEIELDGRSTNAPAPRIGTPSQRAASRAALRVEILDPHAFWDARDGMIQDAVDHSTPAVAEAVAPAAADRLLQPVSQRATKIDPVQAAESSSRTTIQIGAYSSEAAARAAWTRIADGAARPVLEGLSPAYETVQIDGKPLTRLKLSAPADTAAAICHAADVTDPWCLRRG